LRVGGPGELTLIGLFARCAPHGALATHCGTIALRRLLRHGRYFAFLSVSGMTRLLTAKASPAYDRRDLELSLMPPTPCAFQLGGPTPYRPRL
jgi:hypothetical protein